MIYSLKELLRRDMSLSVVSYINEQMSTLLGNSIEKKKLYEMSCTMHIFVNVDEKLQILGIIIMSCKSFLLNKDIFFIELIISKDDDEVVEQSLLLRGLNHVLNLSQDIKLISIITNERIKNNILKPFGFICSKDMMVKI
tara:strand:- start:730 stop:1149 length:420 start_codon:yes stop_codon:yes gene_type:complete